MSESRYPTPEQGVAVNEAMKKAAASLPTVRQVNPLTASRSRKFKLVRDAVSGLDRKSTRLNSSHRL